MLVDMGVAPLEIAERLGHEKVETTLNTYSHLYPSTQSKLAGLLDMKYKDRLRWVSDIYMAGSQNAFTMCGCIYPYSQHWDVDNNWYKAAPMWITFFHI